MIVEMSVELDLESQNEKSIVTEEDRKWRMRKWRYVSMAIKLVYSFTPVIIVIPKPDDELPFISSRREFGDVEMTSISTSLEAHSLSEFNQAGTNHNNDIQQQYANMSIIMKNKDLNSLNQFGGVKGFADTVSIDLEQGLPRGLDHDLEPVQLRPQSNTPPQHSDLIHILKNTCNKYNLMLILLSAILLLILRIKEEGWETGWYQGVIIFLAILFLITVSVTCKYWLLLRWSKTNTLSSDREVPVNVLREGQPCMIPLSKVGLGDIVCLNVGEEVLVDGLFVKGESLKLDEESQPTISDQYPFLFCGSKVSHGKGHMMVIAVGKDTVWSGIKSQVKNSTTYITSLQRQLDKLNTWMQCISLVVTNLLIIVTLLRITFDKGHDRPGSPDLKRQSGAMREFIDIFEEIITNEKIRKITPSLTMILLGYSEGVPLMVTLAIWYWNKRATSDKATTQDFVACVTAGSVTVICTDILNGRIQSDVELDVYIGEELITEKSNIDRNVHKALCDGIESKISGLQRPVSLEEHSLLSWAPVNMGLHINNMKDHYIIDKKELVSSEVNGVLMSKNIVNQNTQNSHWNGPPTEILPMCSHYYDSAGEIKALVGGERENIEAIVENARMKYPKSIAFGYKPNTPQLEETDLILIGTVGLKHSFRKAMEAFMDAGVTVKLVSKRSVGELKTMALQWGLNISNVDSDHSVILGDQFREYTHEQRVEMVDKICIMGNSLQSDKLMMVKCLKEKAHKVLMVGMELDDVPLMLESDLGISMGECFTEAVKGSSKIVISQGNFSTLLSIVKFGRCARENIPKFIRIELTMAFAWSLINIISTSCSGDCPITSIQFFWISLIVPIFGGMALLTMWPNDVLMKKTPERGTETLVPITMWRSIAVEVISQTTILVIFRYKGAAVLGITSKEVVATMMFNSFVLCQVFSWFNAREMKERNVLSEISRNCWFWVAIGVTLALQVTYTEISNIIAKNARLDISQWGACFLIGGASSVVDLLSKCIPDLSHRFLRFKQECYITKSPCMSRSSSSSWPPSLHGLPLLEDDPQGLLATINSIQPCGGESL